MTLEQFEEKNNVVIDDVIYQDGTDYMNEVDK